MSLLPDTRAAAFVGAAAGDPQTDLSLEARHEMIEELWLEADISIDLDNDVRKVGESG